MRGDELRAAIDAVPTVAALDEAARAMWAGVAEGTITETEAEALSAAVGSRRKAIEGRAALRAAVARKAAQGATLWAWRRLEDRARSIGRRRRLAASGPLPPQLAASFTTAELAVLRIVGDTCRDKGACDLTLGEIAARAGCGRTTAQGALRLAGRLGLVSVEERRRPWQRSLPNVVTVTSAEWRQWLARGPRRVEGEGSESRTPRIKKVLDLSESRLAEPSRGLPGRQSGRSRSGFRESYRSRHSDDVTS